MSYYDSQQPSPPGQGQAPSHPAQRAYNPSEYAPRNAGYNPSDYPAPPQSGYESPTRSAHGASHPAYSQAPRSEYGAPPSSYAPPEASQYGGSTERGAIAPYDEEKAYASYNDPRRWEDKSRPPPARSEYGRGYDDRDRRRDHDDRSRYDDRDRYDDRSRYDDDRSRYDDDDRSRYGDKRSKSRDRRSKSRDRRRDDKNDREQKSPTRKRDKILGMLGQGPEGERNLGATLVGGAGGAFLGHEMVGKGPLGIVGGALAGALGANALEQHEEKSRDKYKKEKEEKRRRRREDDPYSEPRRDEYGSEGGYTASSGGATYQQGREYEKGRHHELRSSSSAPSPPYAQLVTSKMDPEHYKPPKAKKKSKGSFCLELACELDREVERQRTKKSPDMTRFVALRKRHDEANDAFDQELERRTERLRKLRLRPEPQKACQLLELPAELRQRVLYYVFADDELVETDNAKERRAFRRVAKQWDKRQRLLQEEARKAKIKQPGQFDDLLADMMAPLKAAQQGLPKRKGRVRASRTLKAKILGFEAGTRYTYHDRDSYQFDAESTHAHHGNPRHRDNRWQSRSVQESTDTVAWKRLRLDAKQRGKENQELYSAHARNAWSMKGEQDHKRDKLAKRLEQRKRAAARGDEHAKEMLQRYSR